MQNDWQQKQITEKSRERCETKDIENQTSKKTYRFEEIERKKQKKISSVTNHLLANERFDFRHQMITSDVDTIDASATWNLSRKFTHRDTEA